MLSKALKCAVSAMAGAVAFASSAMADGGYRGSIKDAPYVAPFSWTGFYVGVNAGYAWSEADRSLALNPLYPLGGVNPIGELQARAGGSLKASGFTGGGQAGYNYQSGALVMGVEADFNYLDLSKSVGGPMGPSANFPIGNNLFQSYSIDWMATVRARLGYAMGTTLLYVTGGLAIADVSAGETLQFTGGTATGGFSDTKTGWTIGGGLEYALNRSWTLKAEYLYADLGKVSFGSSLPLFANSSASHSSDITLQTARVGINYKF